MPPKLKQTVVKSTRNNDDDLQLKGFVDVNGLKAILHYGNEVKLIKEGETFQAVRVVKIAPPKITLQRGTIRWSIQLYDKDR